MGERISQSTLSMLSLKQRRMSEILSVSLRTIERDIPRMKEIGILQREGKDNDGEWIIKN